MHACYMSLLIDLTRWSVSHRHRRVGSLTPCSTTSCCCLRSPTRTEVPYVPKPTNGSWTSCAGEWPTRTSHPPSPCTVFIYIYIYIYYFSCIFPLWISHFLAKLLCCFFFFFFWESFHSPSLPLIVVCNCLNRLWKVVLLTLCGLDRIFLESGL